MAEAIPTLMGIGFILGILLVVAGVLWGLLR